MTDCRKAQLEMIGPQLSLEALQHLERCPACRARLCAEQSLSTALAETPSHDLPAASPATAQALLQALQPQPQAARSNRRWPLLVAAALLLAAPALWFAFQERPEPPAPLVAVEETAERLTPFLVLDPLSLDLAAGRGRLIRARLPPSASLAFGLSIPATEDALEADVLLGDDGVVYAVRFVY